MGVRRHLAWIGAAAAAILTARAGETTFRLKELLGRDWRDELVDRSFEAEPETCHRRSFRFRGPDGLPRPMQLSGIELYPGTDFVKSARVSFLADLPAHAVREWTLTHGPEALAEPDEMPGLGLTARIDGAELLLQNEWLRIRLPAGRETYAEPQPAAGVPGPVREIKLGEGLRLSGSSLYGPANVVQWQGELLAGGPVFGEARILYTYADGRELTLRVRLAARDRRAYWSMDVSPHDREEALELLRLPGFYEGAELVKRHMPDDGWRLHLTGDLPDLRVYTVAEFGDNRWGQRIYRNGRWHFEEVDVELANEPAGTIISLVPWRDWWSAVTRPDLSFNTAAHGDVFALLSERPGEWVEPAAAGTWITWGNPRQRQKWAPIVRLEEGGAAAQFNLASGARHWVLENRLGGSVEPPTLNELSDMIVEWPGDPGSKHPRLYLNAEQLSEIQSRGGPEPEMLERLQSRWSNVASHLHGSDADALGMYLLCGSAETAAETHVVDRLRKALNLMGEFDTMRFSGLVCALYDGLMGTDLIAPEEKTEMRAKMAYLAYRLASPANWSMERGYCSGNENMSVAHVMNLGTVACLLRDHPLAEQWIEPALGMTEIWLREYVGPGGGWPESVANYAHVSCSHLMPFAVAARNSGFHDYVNDIDMKRLALYLSKQYTPPDPRGGGQRTPGWKALPPLGRAGAGGRFGLDGLMAFATQHSDPKLSRQLQWTWMGAGQPRGIAGLGGFQYVVLDPELPSEVPDWTYDVFPDVGAIIRHGIGTPDVWYLNFMCNYSFGYMGESGQFATIFAKGAPISARFAGGYAEREELLISRVLPARSPQTIDERYASFEHDSRHRMTAHAALPRQDYLEARISVYAPLGRPPFDGHNHPVEAPAWPASPRAEPGVPVHWQRQVLFVKDADPGKVNYLVFRDTVHGGQPTMWQWWAVSEKIGTAEEAREPDTFLSDAPGHTNAPARELKGNRLTALGPFGVDTEFFVAEPAGTPRHTLRFGRQYRYSPIHLWNEYMDLLHLQRPDDGAYFVAVLPRRRSEPAPEFSVLGEGHVIRVSGDFGTDYVFVAANDRDAQADGARFHGTAAGVQDRPDALVLSISAPGSVSYGAYTLTCDQACSLVVRGEDDLRVHLPDLSPGAYVTVQAPGTWTLDTGQGSTIRQDGDVLHLRIMQDVRELRLYPL